MILASWQSRRGSGRKPRCRSSGLSSVCRWAPQKTSNRCCSVGHRSVGSPLTKVRQQKRHANNSSSNLRFDPFKSPTAPKGCSGLAAAPTSQIPAGRQHRQTRHQNERTESAGDKALGRYGRTPGELELPKLGHLPSVNLLRFSRVKALPHGQSVINKVGVSHLYS